MDDVDMKTYQIMQRLQSEELSLTCHCWIDVLQHGPKWGQVVFFRDLVEEAEIEARGLGGGGGSSSDPLTHPTCT